MKRVPLGGPSGGKRSSRRKPKCGTVYGRGDDIGWREERQTREAIWEHVKCASFIVCEINEVGGRMLLRAGGISVEVGVICGEGGEWEGHDY